MNYDHAFHAGNHTEVFKHAFLTKLVLRLKVKASPIAVIDTHGGLGITDLCSSRPLRTLEAQRGILKVINKQIPSAVDYLNIVRSFNHGELRYYPGSAPIVRTLLSESDRLIVCELSPLAHHSLKVLFHRDSHISVHHRDGYDAIGAFVPPAERRGLVFIDPPFENKDELKRMSAAMVNGIRKWPTGVFLAWYPIKDGSGGRPVLDALLGIHAPKLLTVEFVPFSYDSGRLSGSGLILCNAPWQFETDVKLLCAELSTAFDAIRAHWSVNRPQEGFEFRQCASDRC